MILIGIGSNLPSNLYGSSLNVCQQALIELNQQGISIIAQSSWYETAPIPASDQPNYVNGVIIVETMHDSAALLEILQLIENRLGRVRSEINAARVIDLDLLAYGDEILSCSELILPHPRLVERAFVVHPLAEVAPYWSHPVSGLQISEIKRSLTNQKISRISV